MAENNTPNKTNASDEIDLGQLFQMIGKGFNHIFRGLLRLFLYLKKNTLVLFGLVILGGAIGFGLNQIVAKKMKTEVIVKPILESKNYLYDVVDEIQANIKAKDTAFFSNIGVDINDLDGLEINIASVDNISKSSEEEIKYFELLQNFENTEAIADIVRAELKNKSSFNHRITFFYKDAKRGQEIAKKIMGYINSNKYFDGLIGIYRTNAVNRVQENKVLLKQVDEIITNYAKKMEREEAATGGSDRIVVDNQERVDITGLFDLKNDLIRDNESKNLELQERTDVIKVINFGNSQQVQKTFIGKNIVLIPFIFIVLYFLISILKYLNRKAAEM